VYPVIVTPYKTTTEDAVAPIDEKSVGLRESCNIVAPAMYSIMLAELKGVPVLLVALACLGTTKAVRAGAAQAAPEVMPSFFSALRRDSISLFN
jgi:hypothetical protein